jgi:O-antigen ligase
VFLSSAATLVFSQTRSALGAFVAAAALVLLLSRRTGLIATVVLATFVLLSASAFESTFLTYLRRGQDAQLLESFSGRTDWWRFAWVRFLERPLTGYGAFAGGRFASLAEMGDQTTSSLHNSYLEAMLGVGILGLLPVLACLIATWWRLLQSFFRWTSGEIERSLRLEAIGVLMVISVRSVFTTDLIWHPALSWFLVLGCAELLRPERRREVA